MAGVFKVHDSFSIKRLNEFYLKGDLIEGNIKEKWFVRVSLNNTLDLTFKIKRIEEIVLFANTPAKLIVLATDKEGEIIDIMLGLNIHDENLRITEEGEE